jgi:hexosaminidase
LTDSLYTVQLTIPVSKIDSTIFQNHATVEIKQSRGNVKYFYTLDGNQPTSTSTPYAEPFQVSKTAELKIIAIKEGWMDSKVATFPLMKRGAAIKQITLQTKADVKLSAKKDSVLMDGKLGSLDRGDKAYLAFLNQDLQVEFKLPKPIKISQLTVSYLENEEQGVLAPDYIEIWGGVSMSTLSKLGKKEIVGAIGKQPAVKGLVIFDFKGQLVEFIRLKVKNPGKLPAYYTFQKTTLPSIFIDEVALN